MAGGPHIELDWEEGVFRGLLSIWKRLRSEPAPNPQAANLADSERALSTLAQILAREPVRLLPARGVGGVRGRDLLIPPRFDLAEDPEANRRLLVVRTAVAAELRRLVRERRLPSERIGDPLEALRLAREAVDSLGRQFAGFPRMHAEAAALTLSVRPDPSSLRGRARLVEEARQAALRGERPWTEPERRAAIEAAPLKGPASPGIAIWGELLEAPEDLKSLGASPEQPPGPSEIESEADAPAIEALRRVELDEKEQEDAVLIHNFEKAETLDAYDGGARDVDGADELDAHLDALDSVDLGDLLRSDDEAHSLLRADLALGLDIPDAADATSQEPGIPYDEWDARKKRYRPEWCTVFPSPARETRPGWAAGRLRDHARLVDELFHRLALQRSQLRPRSRQLDGEDVDLGALVESHGSRCAGRGMDPRLYVRQARQRRDFATTVLLDLSLSTDSWVDGRRVLDVARDAVTVLGEVAHRLDDALQILGFSSHTRNQCRVWEVKGFGETWPAVRDRLGALEPRGYTRIGPAIRHATACLAAEPADRRLLLLVSDGKPTDYDRYEGRYGIADVRQALREAETAGVHPHALAVDAVARDYLPPMFGPGRWHVLSHPERLPEALTEVHGRFTTA